MHHPHPESRHSRLGTVYDQIGVLQMSEGDHQRGTHSRAIQFRSGAGKTIGIPFEESVAFLPRSVHRGFSRWNLRYGVNQRRHYMKDDPEEWQKSKEEYS